MTEAFRALAVLAEPPGPESARIARLLDVGRAPTPDEYSELLLFQLAPYASVYLGVEGMMGGEARDRIAGFWRVLGLTPPAEPDHLSAMLGLYAWLVEAERGEPAAARREAWRRAQGALLWEHLASWLPAYLAKVEQIAPRPYRAWAELLEATLVAEIRRLGPADRIPMHFRDVPDVDVRPGPDQLLVPVRSGIILTRLDLERLAAALHLGVRVGDRRAALHSVLRQDGGGAVRWLEAEASRWIEVHKRRFAQFAAVGAFWAGRAARTAAHLATLRTTVPKARATGLHR